VPSVPLKRAQTNKTMSQSDPKQKKKTCVENLSE
jgi:hypothetical protein